MGFPASLYSGCGRVRRGTFTLHSHKTVFESLSSYETGGVKCLANWNRYRYRPLFSDLTHILLGTFKVP